MASKQVIVYFESPADALRFTLAASSAITGERAPKSAAGGDVNQEIRRATRIVVENVGLLGSE
ncbi:MAG TPA: hypothetical protein VFI82_13345 [Terriglobales bacterium]|jgi:hypothetical protein|nr:hypothetical protein [Terriglobales bacterium]